MILWRLHRSVELPARLAVTLLRMKSSIAFSSMPRPSTAANEKYHSGYPKITKCGHNHKFCFHHCKSIFSSFKYKKIDDQFAAIIQSGLRLNKTFFNKAFVLNNSLAFGAAQK